MCLWDVDGAWGDDGAPASLPRLVWEVQHGRRGPNAAVGVSGYGGCGLLVAGLGGATLYWWDAL